MAARGSWGRRRLYLRSLGNVDSNRSIRYTLRPIVYHNVRLEVSQKSLSILDQIYCTTNLTIYLEICARISNIDIDHLNTTFCLISMHF